MLDEALGALAEGKAVESSKSKSGDYTAPIAGGANCEVKAISSCDTNRDNP